MLNCFKLVYKPFGQSKIIGTCCAVSSLKQFPSHQFIKINYSVSHIETNDSKWL